jgi:hypothetical protein
MLHRQATSEAVTEGRVALCDLTRSLVTEFRRNPGQFDPESVVTLGRAGLRQFLSALGTEPNIVIAEAALPPAATQFSGSSSEGWTHRPSIGWSPVVRATGGGIVAGSLVIAAFAVVLAVH